MGKIFCLIGKSSAGKDTVFKELIKYNDLNLKPVVPYTTRPKRDNEINGVEYYFIDEKILRNYEKMNKIIELRKYDTINGIWYYGTIDDGQIDLKKGNYLLIVTLEAFINVQKYFGGDNVSAFYITVDDGIRLERAFNREKQQENPNYDEMCRRFIADNKDFDVNNLNAIGIVKYYNNYDLKECCNNIAKDMIKQLK